MSDNSNIQNCERQINEAVCIDTKRIYDSCVSKDCLEDLRVTFCSKDQAIIDEATSIKCCCCEVKAVSIDVDDVPFNKGFYSVSIKFCFKLKLEAYCSQYKPPIVVTGYTTFEKKCVLYGGEGSAKIFTSTPSESSSDSCGNCGMRNSYPQLPVFTNPIAKLQTVDPIVLECSLIATKDCHQPMDTSLPAFIIETENCGYPEKTTNAVIVTLGLFSIIQLERDVQMLIPAYDYCIPDKECCCSTQNPCETFQKIDFPIDEFFPTGKENVGGCNCSDCDQNDTK